MDFGHRFGHILMELDNVWRLPVKRLLDLCVEPSTYELVAKVPTCLNLPGVDVHRAELQLLHDSAQRRHAARDVLRLVREGLEEAVLVLLAVQSDDERLRRRRGHSCCP